MTIPAPNPDHASTADPAPPAGTDLDTARAEAFAGDLLAIVNHAFLGIGLSIGERTGLFDTMAGMPPATSTDIAAAAGLNERYVREWLNAMTVGRIVRYDPDGGRYHLPPEHAASMTSAAGPDNLAHLGRFIALAAQVEDEIVECFRRGGGVPYDRYPGFAAVMRDDSAAVFDSLLVDTILPLVPRAQERLASGIDVADVGCGAGRALNLAARAYPRSRFTGYDFSDDAIAMAREEAAAWGLENARFEVRDVAALEVEQAFDLVTAFDAIHDQAHPREVLAAVHRALRPGGAFLMVDTAGSSQVEENMDLPLAPFAYSVSYLHCMTVSLAAGGDGLGTMWGEQQALALLAEAGFGPVAVNRVDGDVFNSYYVTHRT